MPAIIEKADAFDVMEILSLIKTSIHKRSRVLYVRDFAIENSLVQSLEKVQEQFENHVFFKAVIVGKYRQGTVIGRRR